MSPSDDVARRRDLVVLSHLRWDWVWQRPQHLISRISRRFRRTWFVEEPEPARVDGVRLRTEDAGPVTRLRLQAPSEEIWLPFGEIDEADHAALIAAACGGLERPVVWLYTPSALPIAARLDPALLVYDVMDDLTSFRYAPAQLRLQHLQALADADIVLTGGRSLHERVLEHRRQARTVCLPSGVDDEHFRRPRRRGDRPVAGYVGVIDERLDLDLVGELATRLPDWRIRMVGPTAKLEHTVLPDAPNIEYLGKRTYDELPELMAEFDVALMPFALNEATTAISPTKSLEYLAAGLPVVSTRVRDVVRDLGDVVDVADSAPAFARACRRLLREGPPRSQRIDEILAARSWDAIAARIGEELDACMAEDEEADATESA